MLKFAIVWFHFYLLFIKAIYWIFIFNLIFQFAFQVCDAMHFLNVSCYRWHALYNRIVYPDLKVLTTEDERSAKIYKFQTILISALERTGSQVWYTEPRKDFCYWFHGSSNINVVFEESHVTYSPIFQKQSWQKKPVLYL